MALVALVALASSGCAKRTPPPVPPAPAAAPSPPSMTTAPLAARGWQSVTSVRHALEVPLPERIGWAVNDRVEPWLVAQHGPSHSDLRVRTWSAERLSTPEGCLARAQLWRPDLPVGTGERVEDRALVAPQGYRGRVEVTVRASASDEGVEGHVVAYGARTSRCYLLWYRTRAAGPRAIDVVGENLAVVSSGIVDRVREVAVEDVVERAP